MSLLIEAIGRTAPAFFSKSVLPLRASTINATEEPRSSGSSTRRKPITSPMVGVGTEMARRARAVDVALVFTTRAGRALRPFAAAWRRALVPFLALARLAVALAPAAFGFAFAVLRLADEADLPTSAVAPRAWTSG